MAENANEQMQNEKRPEVKKRFKIDEKYTEYALEACYHTGEFTLSLLKRIPSLLLAVLALAQVGLVKLYKIVIKLLKKVASPFSKLFYKTGRMLKALKTKASAAYKSGGITAMFKAFYRVLKEGTERNREAVIKVRNYLLPLAGLFILTFTVFVFSQLTFGLIVEYDGATLGSIKHEQVYDSAEKQLMQRVLFEEGDDVQIVPKFTLA
ncbi:MAG: hypothetical protein IJ370_03070, partial [Oscillospiraceae bacterium]|nr:hypothetical protein [Oscillospiraceae bacterium]